MQWESELTKTLKTKYPIIQAPMLGITTPAMVAAVSNEGGLGSLPVGGLPAGKTREVIQQTKKLTQRSFAVNLFANTRPEHNNNETYASMRSFLAGFAAETGIDYSTPLSIDQIDFNSYTEQVEIIIEENIPIVSFTFGILNDEIIKRLKDNGTILIGTATCVKGALLLADKGIDIITAQGIEAGGHRGTFLKFETPPMIGSMALIPQIADAIQKPVVAAGAIADGRSIKAAFILGAQGVQVGSAFIACNESAAIEDHKKRVQKAEDTDTIITKSFTGRWARGLRNKLIETIEKSEITPVGYPYQMALTAPFRAYGQQQNKTDLIAMWAGQSAAKALTKGASQILRDLIEETEKI